MLKQKNKKKNKLGWQQNSSNSSIAKSAQLNFVLDLDLLLGLLTEMDV